MWYLDKDVEENIIKNMEELGYPPDAVEYAGISNAGKHKFYYCLLYTSDAADE